MSQPEMIVFCGIQASTKTSFYGENLLESHVHISMDVLNSRGKEKRLMDACLCSKQSFVIDNTNYTKNSRKNYISLAKDHKFKVTCYYFDTDLESSMLRNKKRKRTVPPTVLSAVHRNLEKPSKEEGFSDIFVVRLEEGKSHSVKKEDPPFELDRKIRLFSFYINEFINIYDIVQDKLKNSEYKLDRLEVKEVIGSKIKEVNLSILGDHKTKDAVIEIKNEVKIQESGRKDVKLELFVSYFRFRNKKEKVLKLIEENELRVESSNNHLGWLFGTMRFSLIGLDKNIEKFKNQNYNFLVRTS